MSAATLIQGALFTTLSADAAIIALGAGVVDFGRGADDASTIYPYIAIGEIILVEGDTDTTTGFEANCRFNTWGNKGAKQVRDVQGAIYDALHLQDIAVTGYTAILLYRERSQIMRAPSGAFHGVCDYRWLLTKT